MNNEEGLLGKPVDVEQQQQITKEVIQGAQNPPTEIPEKIEPKKADSDWLAEVNREFGKDFKHRDEIKSFFDKAVEYDTLRSAHDESNQKLEEYRKVVTNINPLDYFLSEDEFVRQQFLKKNKETLGEESLSLLSSLSPERIKKLDAKNTLITDMVVNDGLTREEAEAYYSKKYDVDEDSEIDAATKAAIKLDSRAAKERLSKMYDGIEVPKVVDYEADLQAKKESWKNPSVELIKGIDKIKLSEEIDFVVEDSMKEGLEQEILSEMLTRGSKLTKETLAEAAGIARDRILMRNMDKVIASVYNDLREKVKSEVRSQVHNDKPLNNGAKPSDRQLSNDERFLNLL